MRRAQAKSARRDEARPDARRVLSDGDVVDDTYRVTKLIAAGGMGEVYEVVHIRLERAFALKCLRAETLGDQKAARRFLREMRSLAGVRSEHVVAINDCGELADGAPYLVMERLQGQNLRELLKEVGPLVPARAVALIADACLGLGAVHQTGLIHRDLKPENLYVTRRDSGEESCTVLDFGIATRPGNNSTKRESLLGTLKYMAPEQISDSTRVGTWTDVYALGAIFYECSCGHPPHEAETETELMFKIMNSDVLPLDSRIPGFPAQLSRVVGRALSRDPAARHQTVEQFSLALASFKRGGSATSSTESVDTRPLALSPSPPQKGGLLRFSAWGVTAVGCFALGWFSSPNGPRDAVSIVAPAAATSVIAAARADWPARPSDDSGLAPSDDTAPADLELGTDLSDPRARASSEPSASAPPTKQRKPTTETKRRPVSPSTLLPDLDPSPYKIPP
jgi:serine/threonine-protein kinase